MFKQLCHPDTPWLGPLGPVTWDIFQIGRPDNRCALAPNQEQCQGRRRREGYLLLLPFLLLLLMDQSSPHGALSPPTCSGCITQVLESQIQNLEPYVVSRRQWKASMASVDWPDLALRPGAAVARSVHVVRALQKRNLVLSMQETQQCGTVFQWLDLPGTNGYSHLGLSKSGRVYKLMKSHQKK